ncbi:hypothetical protein V1527DRAFT_57367 [Lipomyces starkeyi]
MCPCQFNSQDASEFREHGYPSREVSLPEGLASETLVRTTTGVKRVDEVQVGDFLYGAENRPVLCISAAPPATGNLKKITYLEFDSRTKTFFKCTPNCRLTLTTTATRPSILRNEVQWFTCCDREPMGKDDDSRSNSQQSAALLVDLDNSAADRFAAVKKSLDRFVCRCGGLRRLTRIFETEEQAQLALKILQSDLHRLIDPLIVKDGQDFSMTVQQYERLCSKPVKRSHLKLHRVPLAFDPSTATTDQRDLPIDPYFLGLWLGDGEICPSATITTSDEEIAVWLQSFTDRLNSLRREGEPELLLTKTLCNPASTNIRNVAFQCRIVGPHGGQYLGSPVWKGLRELGFAHDKSGGIPSAYMTADEDTRLAVIAGLIDSDGTYRQAHEQYEFYQASESHRKIVDDLKELALSCGISVTGVSIQMSKNRFRPERTPRYIIHLGRGSDKFQKHLLLPRKKMDLNKTYVSHDARPFTVSDEPAGEYRAVDVEGGQFQMANRVLVYK